MPKCGMFKVKFILKRKDNHNQRIGTTFCNIYIIITIKHNFQSMNHIKILISQKSESTNCMS